MCPLAEVSRIDGEVLSFYVYLHTVSNLHVFKGFDDFSGCGYVVDFLHAGRLTFLRDFIVGVADGRAGLREIMRDEAVEKQCLGGEVTGLVEIGHLVDFEWVRYGDDETHYSVRARPRSGRPRGMQKAATSR